MTMMDGVDDMNSNTDEEESEDETDSEGDPRQMRRYGEWRW